MLDSHCHLDDPRFSDLAGIEARRRAARVRVLVPGVQPASWASLRAEANARGWLFAVGTHPEHLDGVDAPLPTDLRDAVAVGECGLHRPSPVPIPRQAEVLLAHVEIARAAGLPVILHCVRAHDVLPALLRSLGGPLRGVLHSYSGGAELVPVYEALGLHLAFGGAVTWPGARRPVEALRRVSPHRLLLESDGPDQRPRFAAEDSAWGRASEPSMLPTLCRVVEAIRGSPVEEQLERNARELGW